MTRSTVPVRLLALGAMTLLATGAWAQDAARGKTLYWNTNGAPLSCGAAGCHNGFPALKLNNIAKGTSGPVTMAAIVENKGGMGLLRGYVTDQDAADIAAYIANPNVSTGAAALSLSATSLAFGNQTVATPSTARTITVSNTGTAALTLNTLTLGGTNAGDFTRAGTCAEGASLAAGANCSLQITFNPAAAGARSATLTVAHNAAGGSNAIDLTGTGVAAAAAASASPTTLSFTQTVNTTSAAQTVTLSNTGTAALTLSNVSLSGAHATDYAIATGTTCTNGANVAAGANCVVRLTFKPVATGTRTATLTIAHSAAGSPTTVALNGTAGTAPQPAISLSTDKLDFSLQSVSTSSAPQTLTVTNSGQATLNLSAINLGGTNATDFTRAGTCNAGAALAPAASCTVELAFTPSTSGARTASLSIASDAANAAPAVALSGTGVQLTVSVTPTAAALQAHLGAASAPVVATLRNTGTAVLSVASIAVTGPFTIGNGTGACAPPPFTLAAAEECNLYVVFEPQTTGTAVGEVMIDTNATNSPARMVLSAQASEMPAGASAAATPSNVGLGGCSIGAPDTLFDPLLVGMLAIALVALVRRRRQ